MNTGWAHRHNLCSQRMKVTKLFIYTEMKADMYLIKWELPGLLKWCVIVWRFPAFQQRRFKGRIKVGEKAFRSEIKRVNWLERNDNVCLKWEKTFKADKDRVKEGHAGIDFRFRILDFWQFKEFRWMTHGDVDSHSDSCGAETRFLPQESLSSSVKSGGARWKLWCSVQNWWGVEKSATFQTTRGKEEKENNRLNGKGFRNAW